jgi:hypothetical protein
VVTVSIVVETNGLPVRVAVMNSTADPTLDQHTVGWVKTQWRWPEGKKRYYIWDCEYRVR